MDRISRRILPVIVTAQFLSTSLWFAGNGVMGDLVSNFQLHQRALGHLTSAVQFGFIIGTLIFALLSLADRHSPSRLFFVCALAGAACNLGMTLEGNGFTSLMAFRFLTGFFLAGIYPVGMKIASDYYREGLGRSLGYLVGALVVGTAFPHLLKEFTVLLPWRTVLVITSCMAVTGGLLITLLVPDGPFRSPLQKTDLHVMGKVFHNFEFRSAASGYFGHMWELYAFWAFVPFILVLYGEKHPDSLLKVSLLSFLIIGMGGIACILGGYLSLKWGEKRTAGLALGISGVCCLLSPLFFLTGSKLIFLSLMFLWGMAVITDSPLFSTLVARSAPSMTRGTALTIVNCIGFSITIFSIQMLNMLKDVVNPVFIFTLLALGPLFGWLSLFNRGPFRSQPQTRKTRGTFQQKPTEIRNFIA